MSFGLLYRKENRWDGPEYACIRREACDRDADVIVDAEHLLLVRGELSARTLDTETEDDQRERHSKIGTRGADGQRQAIALLTLLMLVLLLAGRKRQGIGSI